jgi:hypothetical protein
MEAGPKLLLWGLLFAKVPVLSDYVLALVVSESWPFNDYLAFGRRVFSNK